MSRRRASALVGSFALAFGFVGTPVSADGKQLHVRIVQVKASGQRVPGKPADLDKDLEPLRAHLEQTAFARFEYLAKAVQKGPEGGALAFDLKGGYKAIATPSFEGARIQLVLLVTKPGEKGAPDEKVFETTTSLKDTATSVQAIAGGVPGGDLLLAITASKDPF